MDMSTKNHTTFSQHQETTTQATESSDYYYYSSSYQLNSSTQISTDDNDTDQVSTNTENIYYTLTDYYSNSSGSTEESFLLSTPKTDSAIFWQLPTTTVSWEQVEVEEVLVVESTVKYHWFYLVLLAFIVAGVLGNTLVCLAICLERCLQNVTNYFLLSLAVADLLVSLVVMPFGLVIGFMGYWPFDAPICNAYVTCDVLACSSSILHMCFISIGRYKGIRNPLKTRSLSKKAVVVKIVLVWLLAMVITSPITVLGVVDAANIQPKTATCAINNRFFFVFGSMFAFYIPMLFMVVAYVLTVKLLKRQSRFGDIGDINPPSRRLQLSRRCRTRGLDKTRSTTSWRDDNGHVVHHLNHHHRNHRNYHLHHHHYHHRHQQSHDHHTDDEERNVSTISTTVTCDQGTQTPPSLTRCGGKRIKARPLKLQWSRNVGEDSDASGGFLFRWPGVVGRRQVGGKTGFAVSGSVSVSGPGPNSVSNVANEQKATKVLGIVFFTFVICWTPFFILNVVFAACPHCYVSERIVDTCLWLGYVSSTINPIIYTIFNRTFRKAFIRLLLCRCVFRRRRHLVTARFYRENSLVRTPTTSSTFTSKNHPGCSYRSTSALDESVC